MAQPYIPAPNVCQVDMVYSHNGNVMENVYHVLGAASWNTTLMQNLAAYFVAWEGDLACQQRSHEVQLDRVSVTDLTTQTSPRIDFTTGLPVVGLINELAYPSNVTIAIKKLTGLRGRSFRGRTYWIGLWQGVVSEDAMGAPALGNIVDHLNTMRSNLTSVNGGQLVVLSRRHANAWRAVAEATPVLSFVAVDAVPDSQRRRLPKHNVHR